MQASNGPPNSLFIVVLPGTKLTRQLGSSQLCTNGVDLADRRGATNDEGKIPTDVCLWRTGL